MTFRIRSASVRIFFSVMGRPPRVAGYLDDSRPPFRPSIPSRTLFRWSGRSARRPGRGEMSPQLAHRLDGDAPEGGPALPHRRAAGVAGLAEKVAPVLALHRGAQQGADLPLPPGGGPRGLARVVAARPPHANQ